MDAMSLSPPSHRLPVELMEAPGGFMWWYADAIDAHGNGFVLIWSWGLPFLPGYASAERSGRPQRAGERPSLNLSVYERGRLDFYTLQEFSSSDASWDGDGCWRFGANEVTFCPRSGLLTANLDLAVPGSHHTLQGELEVKGQPRQEGVGEVYDFEHSWSPLLAGATATMDIRFCSLAWSGQGRGYFDRNGGQSPLHKQPIKQWIWGRLPFDTYDVIYYVTWPKSGPPTVLGLEVHQDGVTTTLTNLSLRQSGIARGLAGIWWNKRLEFCAAKTSWLSVAAVAVVDDGPFYMRFQIIGENQGQTSRGYAELCVPSKIDRARHRLLVKMRVGCARASDDSVWLPLFAGPKSGRVGRLLRSWTQ